MSTLIVRVLALLWLAATADSLRGSVSLSKRLQQQQQPLRALPLSVGGVLPILASALSVAGVVAFHEAGHYLAAKSQGMKISSYNIGYGPKLLAFNDSSNTEFALRAIPLGGYVAFPANVELDDNGDIVKELDDPDFLQNRPPLQRALVISAGVIANIILTFSLATGTALTTGIGRPVYSNGITVSSAALDPSSPGFKAGMRPNDIIFSVNGVPVKGSEKAVRNFISVIRSNANKPVDLLLIRGTGSADAPSAERVSLSVVPQENPGGKGSIGVGINARVERVERQQSSNLAKAMAIGAAETWRLLSFTWDAFSTSVSSGFSGGEVGGPISVVKAGAQMAQNSPQALVGFAATLSVNLALLNSLPFPALDGGQLAFVLFEIATGRPVPRRVKDVVTSIAFAMLLLLGVTTLVGDVNKLGDPVQISRSEAPPPPPKASTAPAL